MFHSGNDDCMRILLLLIFILAPLRHAAAVTRADSLYNCIDEAIANSSKYIPSAKVTYATSATCMPQPPIRRRVIP